LAQCSRAALVLDWTLFVTEFDGLIDVLESRLGQIDVATEFNRLKGWALILNDACGVAHLANRRFLYHQGMVLSRDRRRRCQRLIIAGLDRVEHATGTSIETAQQWSLTAGTEALAPRRSLANAISYVARDAYSLDARPDLDSIAGELRAGRLDVLALIPSFAMIPFTTAQDAFWLLLNAAVDEVADFVDERDGTNADQACAAPNQREDVIATTLRRAIANLRPPGPDTWQTERSGGHRQRDSGQPQPMTTSAALASTRQLVAEGLTDEALQRLPGPRSVGAMSLTDLHEYLILASTLVDRTNFTSALDSSFSMLARRSVDDAGTTLWLARAIQHADLVDDHAILECANYAFNTVAATRAGVSVDEASTLVILSIDQCRLTPGLLAPIAGILADAGAAIFNLQRNRLDNRLVTPWQLSAQLSPESSSVIASSIGPDTLHNNWEIDLHQGVLVTGGVNYFQGLFERVGRMLKLYDVDWDMPAARNYSRLWIRQIDRTVAALEGVRRVAEQCSRPVRLVSVQSHFAPWSAQRVYAETHPDLIEHVTLSSSYESWKTNASGRALSTLAMLNNTRDPQPSLPAFGTETAFRQWLVGDYRTHHERYRALVAALTSLDRAGERTAQTAIVLEQMRLDREQGHTVFCLLGKIPYDLAVPTVGGPAHASMGDWLNHTIRCVNGAPGSSLYIKPHPHEANDAIAAKPVQGFLDVIAEPLSDRIEVLPHRGVNVQDLLGAVDVFLVWNGSSIAELGAQGARVVAADVWAAKNYPIEVFLPRDRSHYERILDGRDGVEMSQDFRELSEAYLVFLTEAPFALPYPMVERSSTNVLFNRAEPILDQNWSRSIDALTVRSAEVRSHFGIDTADR
jgi:hypothetical protein